MAGGEKRKYRTMTKKAKVHLHHGPQRQTKILKSKHQEERIAALAAERRAIIQGYSQEQREDVAMMDVDAGYGDDDIRAIAQIPPPGEEAREIDCEGGELYVFEGLEEDLAKAKGLRHPDLRPRTDRLELLTAHWMDQMDRLIPAYLAYRSHDRGDYLPHAADGEGSDTPPFPPFTLESLDTYSRSLLNFQPIPGDAWPNETLIRLGYIGCAPIQPTLAFSIRALELYRQTHRTCPRFSLEAQCKTMCHMHRVPYCPALKIQFSIAYDAYLEICRRVDRMIDIALGFDTPPSRILRSCPACFYTLKDEPDFRFSCLVSIDGNNSLKRFGPEIMKHKERLDSRSVPSDRWIPIEEVNKFKDEVKSSKKGPYVDSEDDPQWEDVSTGSTNCAERWQNAGPEERKKMFSLFDESGIFIASCRHRMVLAACDMIKSGELAKYPLAVVKRLIDVAGKNIGCAYDIGCAFETTLHGTSLKQLVDSNQFLLMVGAFHGHAHNRSCQLRWHPTYIEGTGHTEGEGCEHVFSSSNDLARSARHASRFHRHQMIEEHFNFWNEDKYANLSTFYFNHYRAALDDIKVLEAELSKAQKELALTPADFQQYLEDEKRYLNNLKEPSPTVSRKIKYIQALMDLDRYQKEWTNARAAVNTLFTSVSATANVLTMNQTRIRVDTAWEKIDRATEYLGVIETELDIQTRWTPSHPEYVEFHQQTIRTSYSKALDELERLVVMRLFELAKMSTSGIGYKLRRQISRALQRRSEAIQKALKRYNAQAVLLDPPRPELSWSEIVDFSFIGKFDLLRYSREDIQSANWAKSAHREAALKYFKLCRAREELQRLDVEIQRLRTFIRDEKNDSDTAVENLLESNPLIARELQRRNTARLALNKIHIKQLDRIEQLPGFTGAKGRMGMREGRLDNTTPLLVNEVANTSNVAPESNEGTANDETDGTADDGELENGLSIVTEFMLSIVD